MKKKLVCMLLSAVLLSGTASAAAWPAWTQDARDWAQSLSFSEDMLDTPEAAVTRGQTAQLLYEAAGRPDAPADMPFTDVPEEYADAVAWAAEQGFVQGVGGGKYNPGRLVMRQE
ncbi:S-layer homology domain-containing protein, partial [Agathobaculum sp.]|uniref:S-layer homology domain-containing protein n=1 Tax=Agathobaculum sp. TaxID=2048138 RepID=UPI0039A1A6BF